MAEQIGNNGDIKISNGVKPGIKTTEMWISLAVVAAAILGTFADKTDGNWGLACAVISAGLYALSRGLAKYK